jgi:hypothetical protein
MPAPVQKPPAPAPPPAKATRKKSKLPLVLLALVGVAGVATTIVLIANKGGKPKGPAPAVGKADTENLPPQVKSVVAKASRVEGGASTELTAMITDPENDPYHAWWSTSCGGMIVARSDAPGRATFLAPTTPGPCAITLEVQDHEMKRGRRIQYTILVTGGA